MSPKSTTVWKYGHWITPVLRYNLGGYSTSYHWGTLTWSQTFPGDDKGYVKVDVLNADDESVLVPDLSYKSVGHDLSQYSAITNQDLKIKVKFWKKTESPIVTKVGIRFKEDW